MPPETSDWEISVDLPLKERQGKKKGKWGKKKENCKREGGKLKMEGVKVCLFVLFCFVFVFLLF